MFRQCNNLTNESLQSIAKMLINTPLVTYKNLNNENSYSPLYVTNKVINEN